MMLRASNMTIETDLSVLVNGHAGEDDEAIGVASAGELLAFVDAVHARDEARIAAAADELATALGDAAVVDAAAVLAHFDGITRVADGSGIGLDRGLAEASAEIREELGLDAFDTSGQ